jgi:hypothetical protein
MIQSQSRHSQRRQLPAELVDYVFSFISVFEDVRAEALRNCSLVCRAWLPLSRQELFARFTLRESEPGNDQEQRRITFFETTPEIATMVAHLRIEALSALDGQEYWDRLPSIFPHVAHLHVRLQSFRDTTLFDQSPIPTMMDKFPRLEGFNLCLVSNAPTGSPKFPIGLTLSEVALTVPIHFLGRAIKQLSATQTVHTLRKLVFANTPLIGVTWKRLTSSLALFSGLKELDLGQIFVAGLGFDLTRIDTCKLDLDRPS